MTSKDLASEAIKMAIACNSEIKNPSANVCINDAIVLFEKGEYTSAYDRSVQSIKHSEGILRYSYKQICILAS